MTKTKTNTTLNLGLAICCLARDCAKRLNKNLQRLELLASNFKETHTIIVENNSKDTTRPILEAWKQSHTNIHLPDLGAYYEKIKEDHTNLVISFNRDKDALKETRIFELRIKRISLARDCYLQTVADLDTRGFKPDLIMMLDLDILHFDIDSIIESIANMHTWQVLSANGRKFEIYKTRPYIRDIYYDSYAVEKLDKPSLAYDWKLDLQEELAPLDRGQAYMPVGSAFGGLALYKYSALFDTKNKMVSYLQAIAQDLYQYCEHISFHRQLRKNGHSQIYINPAMKLYYNSRFHAILRKIFRGKT